MTSLDSHNMKSELDMCDMSGECVVRARGLPWSATPDDVADFFKDCTICGGPQNGIHFTFGIDGRPSGECFVQFVSEEDVEKGLKYNNEHMGKRYIEVFRSKAEEMDWVIKRMGPPQDKDQEAVVRLRGLPYGCSKEEIAQFFTGLEIVPNGITITLDEEGKTTGEAFVEFASPEIAGQAMQKHKEKIGHRYIEIFKSSKGDIKFVTKPKPLMSTRPGPYDRMGPFGGPRFGRGGDANFERRFRGGGRGAFGPVFGGSGFSSFGSDFNNFQSSPSRGGRGGRGGRGSFGGGRGGGNMGFSGNSSTGHTISMRGLPFAAKDSDIKQFLMPLNPVDVRVKWGPDGRCSGEAEVDFATHSDAVAAMSKDRQSMGHRYIELFLNSSTDGNEGNWGSNSRGRNTGGQQEGNFGGSNLSYGGGSNFSSDSGNFNNFGNSGGGGGGNFGNQSNSGNFGNQGQGNTGAGNFGGQQNMANQNANQSNMQNQPFNQSSSGFAASTQNTGSFGGQSNTGYGQSGYGNYGNQGSSYGGQQSGNFGGQGNQQGSAPFNQAQQQQQQQSQPAGYGDTYGSTGGGGSFFGGMAQMKDSNTGSMSFGGY